MNSRFSPLQLILCIALGLWLGAVAIGLSGWLAWRLLPAAQLPPLPASAAMRAPVPPPPSNEPAPAPPAPQGSDAMFQQYQQNLHSQQLRQYEDAARRDPANQGNPQCQFWLEQSRNAPTDQSRENVARLCH